MESFTDHNVNVCPKCKATAAGHVRHCPACGSALFHTPEKIFLRSKGASVLIARISLYIAAIASFVLGMAEGFIGEDSIAMAGNFAISLGVLLMGPWCSDAPRRTLIVTSATILGMYLFLHFTDLSLFRNWLGLRVSVIAFPMLALFFLLSLRREK